MLQVAEEELEREHQQLQQKDVELQQYKARLFATRDIFFLRTEHVFGLVLTRNRLFDLMKQWEDACCAAYASAMQWARLSRVLCERLRRKLQHAALLECWRCRNVASGRKETAHGQSPREMDKVERTHDKTPRKVMKENLERNR